MAIDLAFSILGLTNLALEATVTSCWTGRPGSPPYEWAPPLTTPPGTVFAAKGWESTP